MSVYYKGKLISGIREIPHLTLAEYNALNNKPDMWVRTDAPDSDRGIDADDIEYGGGLSVKDKIDEISAIKIRSGIETDLNFTANTQLEITVNIPNSPFSTNDYTINVAFEYYAAAEHSVKYLIRSVTPTLFVIRAITTLNMTGAKMHWTAIKTS